ncbi:hypothetical protein [Anaeromyxobacter oryzae]|uniref:hypothetical protein n=1 Tax=Anaeromyxobacter oryzae TaxID=2918170 RepID=UPI0020BE1847|nr:hypothetical protein [Anaeromyxobacter oryzae]
MSISSEDRKNGCKNRVARAKLGAGWTKILPFGKFIAMVMRGIAHLNAQLARATTTVSVAKAAQLI